MSDDSDDRQWDTSIHAAIRRQIALTVEQSRRQRELHERQLRRLLRIECYVDTDLMQLEQRIPRYTPCHFPEKEKFKKRLFEIEKERRNLTLRLEEKNQSLEVVRGIPRYTLLQLHQIGIDVAFNSEQSA